MKVVILAGGFGTRISEESVFKPKPMVEIGGMPILWHIMKLYGHYGFNEFVICAGYKQHVIKEYFSDYFLHTSDITFDFTHGRKDVVIHDNVSEPWKVTVVDTGLNTMTGGRIRRIQKYVGDEPFLLTYGDGVSDVNLGALVDFHRASGKIVTLTAVAPGQRFGMLDLDETGCVRSFREKSKDDSGVVNAGFMVCEPGVFDYLKDDSTIFEYDPLVKLTKEGKMGAYLHRGFWQCMDSVREKQMLEKMWASGSAPWKVW